MPGCPEPGPGCRGGRPLPAAREPERARLLERRERGWQQDLVLLRQKPIGPARRRPDALLPGVVPHSGALIEARVGPDVYEPIGAAELDAAGEDDGRELRAFGELRLPPGRHVGQRTGLQRVVTQLEDRPDLPGTDLGHEPERHDDLRAHRADELANLGRPVGVLRRLAPATRTLREVRVPPDVDDLVEGPDLRVPEGGQRGVLLPVLVGLAVALLDLGQAAGGDPVGSDLVDHGRLLSRGAPITRPSHRARSLAPRAVRLPRTCGGSAEALDIVRGPAYLSPHSSWGRFRLDLYTLEPWRAVRDLARDRPSTNHALVPLQGRSAYQPIIHQQGKRWIAYIGHHGGSAPNTLKPGAPVESNGTSIVDVTNPARPVYLFHIPGPAGAGEAGGAQMVRACDGSTLPKGVPGKTYLLREKGTQGHEVFDVTDPSNPVLVSTPVDHLRDAHKSWWECDTGIAYLVSDGRPDGWRVSRMTKVFDLSDPANPVFLRNFGLVGQEPGSTGPAPINLHGPISLGPNGLPNGSGKNRIYFGYGTSSQGVLQIVDRDKLLNDP